MNHTNNDRIATLEAKLKGAQNQAEAAQAMIEAAQGQKDTAVELAAEYERQLKFARLNSLISEGALPEDVVDGLLEKFGIKYANVTPLSKNSGRSNPRKVARQTPHDVVQQPAANAPVPSLVSRLKTIMGKRPTKVDDILIGLQERPGWFPDSGNPKGYISSTLSQNPDFVNVGRGTYAVLGSKAAEKVTAAATPTTAAPKGEKTTPKKRTRAQISQAISDQRKAVAEGVLPTLKDRVKIVLGEEGTLKVASILDSLERRGWSPHSGDPNTYLSTILGNNKDDFTRVSRGHYALAHSAGRKEPVRAKSTNGVPNETKPTATLTTEQVDAELQDVVGGDLSNPFS